MRAKYCCSFGYKGMKTNETAFTGLKWSLKEWVLKHDGYLSLTDSPLEFRQEATALNLVADKD